MSATPININIRYSPVHSPYAEPQIKAVSLAPRLDTIKGKTFALWNNKMRTASTSLRVVERYLMEQGAAGSYTVSGYGPHGIEPREVDLDRAAEADFVIAAAAE